MPSLVLRSSSLVILLITPHFAEVSELWFLDDSDSIIPHVRRQADLFEHFNSISPLVCIIWPLFILVYRVSLRVLAKRTVDEFI